MIYLPPRLLSFLILFGSLCLAYPVCASATPQSNQSASPQDNSEKLRQLLDEMLAAARKNRAKLQAMIQDTEIPENWFTATFGEEKGRSSYESYQEKLEENEKNLEETLVRLAHSEGEFLIQKGGARRKFDLHNNPLDGYRADHWSAAQGGILGGTERIGDFYFSGGKFLWDSTVTYVRGPGTDGEGQTAPAATTSRPVAPTCSSMPNPQYTKAAQAAKVEGSVLVEGTLGLDGRISDVRVLKPIGYGLDEAAIEAVKKWVCSPVIGPDGKPVATKVPLVISFKLLY